MKVHSKTISRQAVSLLAALLLVSPLSATAEDSAEETGKKLSDPTSDVWALFTEFDVTYSEGDLSNGNQRSGSAMIFQPIMPFAFTENSKLITRPTLPVIFSQDIPSGINPDGSVAFDTADGLGDMSLPLLYTPNAAPGTLKWGFGPTFVFPTATDDDLGTDTWEVGPAGVLVYAMGELQLAVLGQYWWNYAESGNNVDDTSHGTLLYSAWYNLPKAWQVGFNPTITYNDKANSDNAWNVPVGLGVAKTTMLFGSHVKFQFSVEKSVVRQDDFGADWKIRLNIIPVIKSPQSGSFF
jgi:hypothetical protein